MQPKTTPTIDETILKALSLEILNDPKGNISAKHGAVPRPLEGMEGIAIAKWADIFTNQEQEVFKSMGVPPSMYPFSRLTTMPDQSFNGILQWPGAMPGTLKKIAADHLGAQIIMGLRVADVARYSKLSSHPWRPGWRVETKVSGKRPSTADLKKIREAELYIQNSNVELFDARTRDAKSLCNFQKFLASVVRNTLTYDGIAIWTDMSVDGRIKAFAALDASLIRLINKEVGYAGDKKIYAVAVNESMEVQEKFTRNQIVWSVRNPRLDPDVYGYGYPEIERAARIIEAYSNAFELNMSVFTKSAIPPAILKLKGTFTQKQLDFWNRIWTNIVKGVSKKWVMPVIKVPADGDVEIVDLSVMKGTEVYYKEFINMVMGALCAVYRFPVHRLGYKMSGSGKDEEVKDAPEFIDEEDIGLMELLNHLETLINEYLLWPNYPELQFCFTGKSPKEDAREYENRALAMTIDERRASADLPPLHELVDEMEDGEQPLEEEEKTTLSFIARLIGMAPTDPGQAGVFQAVVAAMIKQPESGLGGEAMFPGKKDPVESEKHGATSGVRRDSAKERASAGGKKKK